ncbi:MAG: SBBP repeat-containing protein [Candidatus Acidiferrales bacterium]
MDSRISLRWVTALGALVCAGGALMLSTSSRVHRTAASVVMARPAADGTTSQNPAQINVSNSASIKESYGKLPLAFEPNNGQSAGEVKFLARGNGYTLFLTPAEAVFAMRKSAKNETLRMNLDGANSNAKFTALDELPGKSNYLIGNDRSKWQTNVPNYRAVRESSVYPGIDLVYYGNQRQLEYDFVVAPGANPRAIELAFSGVRKITAESTGDLGLTAKGGEMRLRKPVAYQENGGAKQFVTAGFVVKSGDRVAVKLGKYDPLRPLVIDPILAYSTYLGGSGIDGANGIAVAPDGTAFVAGGTSSTNFPTAHPLQPNDGGSNDFPEDAFVAKLSADGSSLIYSTYLGGSSEDVANGIAVDTFGSAYVVGGTLSPDFPVTPGSFNTLCGGDGECGASYNQQSLVVENAFVSKLNAAGSDVVYSGFLGEYENVIGYAIAVDLNGNAYVTGQTGPNGVPTVIITPPATGPPPFPIVNGAQTAFGGGTTDAFVAQVSATGSSILYSTYLGGNNEDTGYGVAVNNSGDAYVAGLSYSTNFPVSAGALQSANEGAGDAFAAEVNTNAVGAASLVYSTLMGGSGLDRANAVAIDALGNMYVAGASNSTAATLGFAIPAGGFQADCVLDSQSNCEGDVFVAKLDPAGSGAGSLIYFTYIGGSLADTGAGIAVDSSGDAYVTGSTVSPDYPTTAGVFQATYGGGNDDAFVTELDPTGSTLIYSTYLGGTNTDNGNGIAVDTNGSAYVAGQTCSVDFPLANPEQSNPGGNCDAFISKISTGSGLVVSPAGLIFPDENVGTASPAETVTLTAGTTAVTISSITVTGTNAGDFAATTTCTGTLAATGQCTISVIFTASVGGAETASIQILDNAPGSPQIVNLSGTGLAATPGFTIAPVPGAASVTAGQSANYGLTVTAVAGFTSPVSLTCAPAPQAGSCSITPPIVIPASGSPGLAVLTIKTGARTFVTPISSQKQNPFGGVRHFGPGWFALIFALMLMSMAMMANKQQRRRAPAVALGFVLSMLFLMAACGGGGPAGVPNGTPAGTYTVTVTGTSGSTTSTTQVTIQVN